MALICGSGQAGMTPLHLASFNDHLPVVTELLDRGALIDRVDEVRSRSSWPFSFHFYVNAKVAANSSSYGGCIWSSLSGERAAGSRSSDR